jgi:[ribosomal protein S5]-alanine N-acetyltransferase
MKGPERIQTARLRLRKPELKDAEAMFCRYASDPEVTRFLSWPTHGSIEETMKFVRFSDAEWERWPAGPYLIESLTQDLLGSTGLSFESPTVAATGYVLARDAWGRGYATEALAAMVQVAGLLGLQKLYALCHPGHERSAHVLRKCGFLKERVIQGQAEFPNLSPGQPQDCLYYSRTIEPGSGASL